MMHSETGEPLKMTSHHVSLKQSVEEIRQIVFIIRDKGEELTGIHK